MASVALTIVGGIVAGPAGAMAGAAVGSIIDQAFIYPALFGKDDVDQYRGPTLDKIQYQTAEPGSPANYGIGPHCRTTGTVVWESDIFDSTQLFTATGKGGGDRPDAQMPIYYYKHCAIAFNVGKTIGDVQEIIVDGKSLYYKDRTFNETSTLFYYTTQPAGAGYYLIIWSPYPSGPDLSQIKPGWELTMSGWSGSDPPNHTYAGTEVIDSKLNKSDGWSAAILYTYYTINPTSGGPGDTVTVYQYLPDIFPSAAESLTFYNGSSSQTADTTIRDYERTKQGNDTLAISAMRGTAYFVLEQYNLKDTGNRLPQFSIIYAADASTTVADAIDDLCDRAGLAGAEYDTSELDADTFNGIVLKGIQPVKKSLQPIMIAYNVVAQEAEGVLKFINRHNTETISINADDLAAHDSTEERPMDVATINDKSDTDISSEVIVNFLDLHARLEGGSQRARNYDANIYNQETIQLPLALSNAEAKAIADQTLWTALANRQSVNLQLPGHYMQIQEEDIVSFTAFGETWPIRITKIDRGANELLAMEGVVERASALDFDWTDSEEDAAAPLMIDPPLIIGDIIDIGPLRDDHASQIGYYYALAPTSADTKWRGATLYESLDGTNYDPIASSNIAATMGRTDDALGSVGLPECWDYKNTVDVRIFHGELSSASEADVLNGANRAKIGSEVIGYMTATVQASSNPCGTVYRLSNLLRGLLNTEGYIGTHSAYEKFTALNEPGVQFIPINARAIATTRYYKFVPADGVVADYNALSHYHVGATARPYAPCNIQGTRDGSNNLTITWDRRMRSITRILSDKKPKLDAYEKYEIDVFDGDTRIRLITAEDATTATYTAAQQTADGLTPGDPVKIQMYQVSPVVGRGVMVEITI